MQFGVLGPLTLDTGDGPRPVPAGLPRTVLAVLLMAANTTVSTDRLIDEVWLGGPPRAAVESLRNHIVRLRRQLGPRAAALVRTDARGYRLELGRGELDEHEFSALCAAGREALQHGDRSTAATLLTDAQRLWRGRPYTDVALTPEGSAHVERLTETRLLALEGRFQAELHLGRHREAVAELQSLATLHPLREEFHAQLMLALFRSGRQADAQAAYQNLWHTLRDELAVEPSARIRSLHSRILAADPGLAEAAPTAACARRRPSPSPHPDRRAQLPAGTRTFIGRNAELDLLSGRARQAATGAPHGGETGAAAVFAIDGMGGVGKTALAVHAAHRLRPGYPDGQLFLDLGSHSTDPAPLSVEEALGALLGFLGLPPDSVPADPRARAALYRSLLDGTRTLIVLDNASSAAQVRPLLPAEADCLVLVTSRDRLVSLDDAQPLSLGVLSQNEAHALLHETAGPGRIPPAEEADLDELAALCGYLPLTLRIAASRLRHRTTLRVRDLIGRLENERTRLTRLSDEERSLAAVFESSFAGLPAIERLLLHRLGLAAGADFDGCATTALLDCAGDAAEQILESLLDHNLLTEPSRGRYRLHDLLRIYASAPSLPDRNRAAARMRAERGNLLAGIAMAAARVRPRDVIAISTALAA